MKRVLLGLSAFVLFGCAMAQMPVNGTIYADVHGPVNATEAKAGTRVGEACASSILGIVATGDASIEAARKNGGMSSVSSVDHHSTSILGFYAKFCTVVRGN